MVHYPMFALFGFALSLLTLTERENNGDCAAMFALSFLLVAIDYIILIGFWLDK